MRYPLEASSQGHVDYMAQHRCKSKEFLVYVGDTNLGWRIIRTTSFEKGERLVLDGRFERLFDALTGKHIAYRISGNAIHARINEARFSSTSLTERDAQAIAGLFGKSKTAGMSEEMRLTRTCPRTGKHLATEDFIERAAARVEAYTSSANVRGDLALRVYPKERPPKR